MNYFNSLANLLMIILIVGCSLGSVRVPLDAEHELWIDGLGTDVKNQVLYLPAETIKTLTKSEIVCREDPSDPDKCRVFKVVIISANSSSIANAMQSVATYSGTLDKMSKSAKQDGILDNLLIGISRGIDDDYWNSILATITKGDFTSEGLTKTKKRITDLEPYLSRDDQKNLKRKAFEVLDGLILKVGQK